MKIGSSTRNKEWKEAVTFYVDLLTKYGPLQVQNAATAQESLALFK